MDTSNPPRHRCTVCGQQRRQSSSMFRVHLSEGVAVLACSKPCVRKAQKRAEAPRAE